MTSVVPPPVRGQLFVLIGASGVGKGTLRERLLSDIPMFYSVSWTTRGQRPGERDGIDYHFRSREQFEAERATHDGSGFLEHAVFAENLYGTPRAPVEATLSKGENVMLEIEVLGGKQVREAMPEAVMIFIMPPSLSELERRLRGRATENEESIKRRLSRAIEEIRDAQQFDYIVVNDDLERALDDLKAIVRAEGLLGRRWTRARLEGVLSS